jgi:hypothetical protein
MTIRNFKLAVLSSVVVMLSALLVNGCAIRRAAADVTEWNAQWLLVGNVTVKYEQSGKLLAVVYGPEQTRFEVVSFRVVPWQYKKFAIVVPPGNYTLALIHDRNGNFTADPDDPVLIDDDLDFSEVVRRLDRTYDLPIRGRLPEGYPIDYERLARKVGGDFPLAVGELADLSDPRFSAASGEQGAQEHDSRSPRDLRIRLRREGAQRAATRTGGHLILPTLNYIAFLPDGPENDRG